MLTMITRKQKENINKKVLGTKIKEYKGITFKSTSEYNSYKILENSELEFYYEPEKIKLFDGTKLVNTKLYAPNKLKNKGTYDKTLELQTKSLIAITYTPDFKIIYKDYIIYADIKGNPNDTYPIKKKMFLKYLESLNSKTLFFEPHNMKQVHQMISIIKELE